MIVTKRKHEKLEIDRKVRVSTIKTSTRKMAKTNKEIAVLLQ